MHRASRVGDVEVEEAVQTRLAVDCPRNPDRVVEPLRRKISRLMAHVAAAAVGDPERSSIGTLGYSVAGRKG
jgi:hypothetical protein